MILNEVNRTLGLLRKPHNILSRSALPTIHKGFVRPHLDYGSIIYDQAYKTTLHQKLELIQYNACLVLTRAIRHTSKQKFYEKLGLESLQYRRLYIKPSYFYKFSKNELPQYFFKLIPVRSSLLEVCKMFLSSKQDITFEKNIFSCQPLYNGIILI